MPAVPDTSRTSSPSPGQAADVFLLGTVDYGRTLELQHRLVYEAGGRSDGRVFILLCEHPAGITVGRSGSWQHIRMAKPELAQRRLAVQWVGRGGGCLVHGPGQLAVYVIAPLEHYGWSVGDYLQRLQRGLHTAVTETRATIQPRDRWGVWGRTGQLGFLSVGVRHGITLHGAFLNVSPDLNVLRRVDHDPEEHTPASSLTAELHHPVKMSRVREAVMRSLTESLGQDRYHLYTGHPLLNETLGGLRERAVQAG